MNIAILGTGSVAQTWATRLVELGNTVTLGTRNVENTLSNTEKSINDFLAANANISLKTFGEAVLEADVIVNATQGAGSIDAVGAAYVNMKGKILVDVSNPLDFSGNGLPSLLPSLSNTNSLGEEIQKSYPEIKVVKTLNTMWCGIMVNPNMIDNGNHVNFISGNDANAKAEVKEFIKKFGWKEENILDLGDITNARGTEAMLPIWLRVWTATQNGAFNFRIAN
jgi:8-hydroxy-5-deazaflavin:NADPH oxidoreductase